VRSLFVRFPPASPISCIFLTISRVGQSAPSLRSELTIESAQREKDETLSIAALHSRKSCKESLYPSIWRHQKKGLYRPILKKKSKIIRRTLTLLWYHSSFSSLLIINQQLLSKPKYPLYNHFSTQSQECHLLINSKIKSTSFLTLSFSTTKTHLHIILFLEDAFL
jgi:hypothetical protein